MTSENSKGTGSSIDAEWEIPLTAIVDMNKINGVVIVKENKLTNKNAKLNPENMCRACLNTGENMITLFSTEVGKSLANMFCYITCIKLKPHENLPLQICEMCQKEIVNFYNFKIKCHKSDNLLKSTMDIEINSNEDDTSDLLMTSDKETQTLKFPRDYRRKIVSEKISNTSNQDAPTNLIQKSDESHFKTEIKPENQEYLEAIEYLNDNFGKNIIENVEKLNNEIKDEISYDIEYIEDDIFTNNTYDNIICNNDDKTNKDEVDYGSTDLLLTIVKEKGLCKNKNRKKHLQCEICSKTFFKFNALRLHIKQNHSPQSKKPFPCDQCKESFNSEHDCHLHSALHSPKNNKWTCNKCFKEFQVRNLLRRHIQRHMEWKRFSCEWCGKAFAERCALRRHARVHTGEPAEKRFSCDLCDKKFSDRSQLRTHAARHSGARAAECEQCGRAFRSRRLLASHRRVHSDDKPHACRYCDRRFRHESTRNTHHRTHTGEKPYVCSICGKTFIQNSNLTRHMRKHTGEKPYPCDICGRSFSSGSTFKTHRRTHTGEKPYSCPICPKRFARTDFRSHLRLHSGERPFRCCACPKAFVSASALRTHCLIHTGEKAFECAICSDKFTKKSYLVKHLKCHEPQQKARKSGLLVVQQVPLVIGEYKDNSNNITSDTGVTVANEDYGDKNSDIICEVTEDIPLEVSGELILQDSDVKTELLVVDKGQHNLNFQGNEICLDENNVSYVNNDVNYVNNDVNLVIVDGNDVDMSSSSVLESPSAKLYQLDQSLVQIETSSGNLTIRKITSKMTTHF